MAQWQHRFGSTLAQVMTCCLTTPSHYMNQWLAILMFICITGPQWVNMLNVVIFVRSSICQPLWKMLSETANHFSMFAGMNTTRDNFSHYRGKICVKLLGDDLQRNFQKYRNTVGLYPCSCVCSEQMWNCCMGVTSWHNSAEFIF